MKREDRKQILAESIVCAGFDLLTEKTWSAVTSDELAKKAGMTKRTMYMYFPSQDALYLQLVKRSFERFNDWIETALRPSTGVIETLLSVGESYFTFYRSHPVEGRLIITFDSSLFELKYPNRVLDIALVANRYEPSRIMQESGCDPKAYPPSLGLFLWSSIQGLLSLLDSKSSWMYQYYQTDYDTMVRQHMAWLHLVLSNETRNGA